MAETDPEGAAVGRGPSGREVGHRLSGIRHARGLSLAELAAATGLSISTLSRLESGLRRPTLEVLLVLARVYRVTLDQLVGAPATGDPRVHPRPITRFGMTWLPLTRRPGGIQAYKLVMPVGFPAGGPQPRSHEGYEWLYVLEGPLLLLLGDQELRLDAGEIAEFDTTVPHAFANPGPRPVELLTLLGPQGQRAHVRARAHSTRSRP